MSRDRSISSIGETPLIRAAIQRDLETVQDLIAGGTDVNHVDKLGKTALLWTISMQHWDIALALIAAGANVNCIDTQENTAIDYAITFGKLSVAEALIAHGAIIRTPCNKLLHAIEIGDTETACFLIKNAFISDDMATQQTLSNFSIFPKAVQNLISAAQQTPTLYEQEVVTIPTNALMCAARKKNAELVNLLLKTSSFEFPPIQNNEDLFALFFITEQVGRDAIPTEVFTEMIAYQIMYLSTKQTSERPEGNALSDSSSNALSPKCPSSGSSSSSSSTSPDDCLTTTKEQHQQITSCSSTPKILDLLKEGENNNSSTKEDLSNEKESSIETCIASLRLEDTTTEERAAINVKYETKEHNGHFVLVKEPDTNIDETDGDSNFDEEEINSAASSAAAHSKFSKIEKEEENICGEYMPTIIADPSLPTLPIEEAQHLNLQPLNPLAGIQSFVYEAHNYYPKALME